MRRLVLLFIVLFNYTAFAQNAEYSIVVKDIETQLPIENATVFIMKTKQTLLSNADGKVTFMLNGSSSLEVTQTDYEKITLRWGPLKPDMFVVYLKSNNTKLDEIVVSKENPQKNPPKNCCQFKAKTSFVLQIKSICKRVFYA